MFLHRSAVALLTVVAAQLAGCASGPLVVPPLPERTAPLAQRQEALRSLAPVRGTLSNDAPVPVVRINGGIVSDPGVYGAVITDDAELNAAIDDAESLGAWSRGAAVTGLVVGLAGSGAQLIGIGTMLAGGFNPSAGAQPSNDLISRGYGLAVGGAALSMGGLTTILVAAGLLEPARSAAQDLVVDRYDRALRMRLALPPADVGETTSP